MTPGRYLGLRREAAGLTIEQSATRLAALPWAIRPACQADIVRLTERLRAAEADRDPFSFTQAELLASVVRFDPAVYEQLLAIAAGAPSIAHPHICRTCACSWHDPCQDSALGPCAWSDGDLGICTACERAALAAELAPAAATAMPQPTMVPA